MPADVLYECRDCGSSGRLWIVPSGHLFQYPGGPARGAWPSAYEVADPIKRYV